MQSFSNTAHFPCANQGSVGCALGSDFSEFLQELAAGAARGSVAVTPPLCLQSCAVSSNRVRSGHRLPARGSKFCRLSSDSPFEKKPQKDCPNWLTSHTGTACQSVSINQMRLKNSRTRSYVRLCPELKSRRVTDCVSSSHTVIAEPQCFRTRLKRLAARKSVNDALQVAKDGRFY
ncbi:hypothetical protein BaRGS_00008245 [Batillaria attramentaria]|uniref:Uncharacterized protein n=1 Tax=Batillaria attramentaria TaxID=370345 RepID=A0ABD0LMZ3_9CAEN